MREGILVGYENVNIFQIYFPIEKKIERVRDVTFVEKHEDKTLLYAPVNSFLPEESFDPVIPDESVMPNTPANFTNLNHQILSLPKDQRSLSVSSTSSTLSQ